MLQNCQPRRNFRSFRRGDVSSSRKKPAMAATAANLTTVRLSSGISANILDFGIPQKHVVADMTAMEAGRSGEVQTNQASRTGSDGPRPKIAPVPTAGSKRMSLKFEIQPAANPTSEKDRTAKLVDPGFGRIF